MSRDVMPGGLLQTKNPITVLFQGSRFAEMMRIGLN